MNGMCRADIVRSIERHRVSAIIRTHNQKLAAEAMNAAVEGGFRMVEFTLTTPGALTLIAEFAAREGLLVGAGTVLSVKQARESVAAGAKFLVSPIVDPQVIREANDLQIPVIPGTMTPTEMESATRLGADLIKVFPAPFGGVEFVQAILGPLPHLRLFPTGGVTSENFLQYLDAGCAGVGFVRSLFDPAELAQGDFHRIRHRAKDIIDRLGRV